MECTEKNSLSRFSDPKVSIVILNWNRLDDIIECLHSVRRLNYPCYEIIVVDNASNDGSPEVIKKLFSEIILIKNKVNLGYAGGNNTGMRYALNNGCKYIWLLNNDAILEADTLSKLIAAAETSSRIGILSPVIYFYSTPSRLQYCGGFFDWEKFTVIYPKAIEDMKRADSRAVCVFGTAPLIKSEVIKEVGYLDEKYFSYWEDHEYSLRLLKAGYSCKIEFSTKILHKCHYTDIAGMKKLPTHYFYYMARNEYWFWMVNIHRFQKVKFFKKYISKWLKEIGTHKELSLYENCDACLDGMYSAFCNVSGDWVKRKRMPKILKKFILWHPYLWSALLEGDFRKINHELYQRFKKSF